MSRLISFAVLIAIIIIIGLLFYKVLIGFFIPVFLAAVLVVVFRPLHQWVLSRVNHRDRLAAAITTLMIVLVLFLPVAVVTSAAAIQGLRLIKNNDSSTLKLRFSRIRDSLNLQMPPYADALEIAALGVKRIVETSADPRDAQRAANLCQQTVLSLNTLKSQVSRLEGPDWDERFDEVIALVEAIGHPEADEFGTSKTAVELSSSFGHLRTDLLGGPIMALARERANPSEQEIESMTASVVAYAQPKLLSLTGATGTLLIKLIFGGVILVVATFFFLYDGPSMVKTIMYLSPLDDAYEQELLLEFDRISRAVVLATILSAVVQGLTAGMGYLVAGMEYLTLLIMLTTVFAMVPFVGPAVIWVPVCLYLGIYEERVTAAILLACWGVLVVGTVDNLVKAFVLHGQSQLHPLLALLSVLGGVQALGPVGIVVGPMVVAMLQTLLSILQRELMHFDKQNLVLSTEGLAAAGPDSSSEAPDSKAPPANGKNGNAIDAHGKVDSGGDTTQPRASDEPAPNQSPPRDDND